ncbi:hypothetical protein [Kingella oralis]|uniref:hypothetical protein n=1 Tax=Kingella oralis TaxID=505 RepID=UPI0034E45D7C
MNGWFNCEIWIFRLPESVVRGKARVLEKVGWIFRLPFVDALRQPENVFSR